MSTSTVDRAGSEASAEPQTLRHLIAGAWRPGEGSELRNVNPARPLEVVATGRLAQPHDVDDAVAAARKAFPGWAATPPAGRAEILFNTATILARNCQAWGAELSREEGKTLAEGIGEVRRAADIFRFYAGEASRPVGELFASSRAGESIQVVNRPVGVVAAITPFNFPIAIPAWKIAPALTYGNTVVWKPASTVPVLAIRLAEALVEAGLPAGVLSLLIAGAAEGGRLVEHPGVDLVTFTGSTTVGRHLIQRCGLIARPIQAEMGGKNGAAVLTDANLELAAAEVVAGAFRSTGQKCTATSRLIVTERIADEFLSILLERAQRLRVGDPLDPETEMGPLISVGARDTIHEAIAAGQSRTGTDLLTGGRLYTDSDRAAGAFLAPTIMEITGDDTLWQEELFGPVLAVKRAKNDQHALDLLNDGPLGLSAAVFTDNLRAVTAAIEQVQVGILHINSETAGAEPHVPFGGAKQSAFGPKEQGRAAREFFTTTKTVYLRASGELSR